MIASMKIYAVYLKPGEPDMTKRLRFVAENFSIAAFVAPMLWALYYRVYWLIAGLAAWYVFSNRMLESGEISQFSFWVLQVAVNLLLSFSSGDIVGATLKRRGYDYVGTVTGRNMLESQRRYLDRHLPKLEMLFSA